MAKSVLTILITFLFVLKVSAQSESIKWQKDYKSALALSRETGKPILIDFWAKWCKPCLVLDEEFWMRADVVEAVKPFVPLKIDYDLQRDLAKQFIVRGLPYIAFSDPFGNYVTSRGGFGNFGVEDFRKVFKEIPKNFAVLNNAFKTIELKKDDSAALIEIADYYAKNKMATASVKYYEMAYRTPELKRNALKREIVAAKIGEQFSAAGSFYHAAYAFEDYLKFFPRSRLSTIGN
jgi:thiol-disulfide isomerase/thioredoxin